MLKDVGVKARAGGESGALEAPVSDASDAIASVRSRMAKRQWDLDLHRQTCYMMQVSIWRGVPSKVRVNFEQLGLSTQVVEELEALGASEPKIAVFEEFDRCYNRLDSSRKKIQALMKCSNRVWFLPQDHLIEVNQLLEEMEAEAEALRDEALEQYEPGLEAWMQGIETLLREAGLQGEQMALALESYRASFPRREDVEAGLSISVTWLGEIQPISETIKASLELQAAEARAAAERAAAEGQQAEADAARHQAALLAMQLKGMEQQEKLLQSVQGDAAAEIRQVLQEQQQMILRAIKGDRITAKTHAAVMQACDRLNTLLGLVGQSQRTQLAAQVAQVTEQVKAALNAPRGAFESSSLDAEIWACEQALERFAGDYSGAEAQAELGKLVDLQARVGLLTDVLDNRAQGLADRLEQVKTRLAAGSPGREAMASDCPVYDPDAGF